LRRIHDQIAEQQRVGLAILLAGLGLGIGGGVFLARRLTRPVKRLAGAMEAVARGDMDQTVQVSSGDELASLAESFNRMTRALREKRRVREVFSLYMAGEVIERILRESEPLEMIPEERAVTVVSLSLHNHASLARQMSPRESIGLLNDYLAPIIDAVAAFGGTIDQLDGPRVVVVWGAPSDVRDPELKAISAALAARDAVVEESRRQMAAGGPQVHLCAGVCTGRAVAGNIGSARRVAYRVLGGAAELAREIERLARPGEILASEATYAKVRDRVAARAGAPLMLEEMDEAVPLYRIEAVSGRR
jgi:class 3 adenylate cyclase